MTEDDRSIPRRVVALVLNMPQNLVTLEEAAAGVDLKPERLLGLADGGYAPHYRIDGGPPQFRMPELRQWVANNLVEHVEGRKLPEPVRIITDAKRVSDYRKVPVPLREIVGLCDVTSEIVRTGVYFLCREGVVLYVGQSVNVASRIHDHYKRWEFDSTLFLPWPADDLDRLEGALIRALRPSFNGKHPKGKMHAPFADPSADAGVIASITNPQPSEPAG